MQDSQRKALRQQMRSRRRQLTPRQILHASRKALRILQTSTWFRNARRIALYQGQDGELNPLDALLLKRWPHKHFFLPCLITHLHQPMQFRRYRPGSPLRKNHFGIAEPRPTSPLCHPAKLDLVVMPLVAFDTKGNRLGMGGGFYDRTFAFMRHKRRPLRPKLIGLAHDFQQTEKLPHAPWDVPLKGLVTPSRRLTFKEPQ